MAQERMTIQRLKILEFLRKDTSHPTAEEVYAAIKPQLSTITLATVYRNLNVLADKGEIICFKVGNTYHFDGQLGAHIHGICQRCGRIVDVHDEKVAKYAMNKIRFEDFIPTDVRITFRGTCKDGCEEQNKRA